MAEGLHCDAENQQLFAALRHDNDLFTAAVCSFPPSFE